MKMLNLFSKSVVSVAVFAAFGGAVAAENGRATMAARMPIMPTVSLNTIGNPAVKTINQPAEAEHPNNVAPTPTPTPVPVPTPTPQPDPEPQPQPQPSECPDGGVKNSTYTVSMCMDDLRQCVNTGALAGGINDLFNEDVRNAIMNGMQLCQSSVDKCIADVRVDCSSIYNSSADVWLDFNSRVVQPEYYNFVLRKTGLTPNQAENTCLLLDRNTYGSSFAAVSDKNAVNGEYRDKVGAYNGARNDSLSKNNPQGVAVNTTGYDGNRGHYARWDATNAECLLRVAAYNKDKLITNSWLFGAVGNDNPAEVWRKTGSTFICGKDLFDFSLMNDTKTAAVVGVGTGTVLGTAIGAAAGAGAYNRKMNAAQDGGCENPEYRQRLGDYIQNTLHMDDVIKNYIGDSYVNFNRLTRLDCEAIHGLYSKAEYYKHALDYCSTRVSPEMIDKITGWLTVNGKLECSKLTNSDEVQRFIEEQQTIPISEQVLGEYKSVCLFKNLNIGLAAGGSDSPLCESDEGCVDYAKTKADLSSLQSYLAQLEPVIDPGVYAKMSGLNKGKEIAKGAAIGAATGAGAGGLATAITAFVEKGNISCKVGDGLSSVAMGKSHTIDSLKDIYVKWNLRLPDSVAPTSTVVDKASWEQACSQFNSNMADCPRVQINFKKNGKSELIESACVVSGSVCAINKSVAKSHRIR